MGLGRLLRPAVAGALLVVSAAGAARPAPVAQQAVPAAMSKIALGQWELKARDAGSRTLCLTHRATLIQLVHGTAQCSQVVMESSPNSATVRYSCPGRGQGRTTIIVETPQLINIDTQGVIDGEPFTAQFEGRRVGACR
ncbi:DUF3617 domain-containing protein [Sphingomonas hengshuiensis]|uniref:DUF3617 domain-containing protein n=1 Tax=Sphingomonas hengshuiensis TaxID=1609977 RepID=A0A7U5BEN6_9SPHN|nr:DUF3617 family protein [Sphingomonas hengshuiensis]AJP70901.1 hypothetical protein TS85_02305 [Sphingomonas hengshuiensis]